jgi:phosphoglycolate phosphatase-like HAD superfamily hydrolase
MVERIVLVDFAGTLVKAEMIEKANEFRSHVLEKSIPTTEQHAHSESLYKVNREFVEKLTGLPSNCKVKYRENDLEFLDLSGADVQNQIATTLFQIGMYMVAKEHGKNIFPEGLLDQLARIQQAGYKLAIVSGVRTDIISGMLQIAGSMVTFDYIYGQPPKLGKKNQDADVKELKSKGSIVFSLGDKLSDLERGTHEGCKTIFVTWGHAMGGEKEIADYTINSPTELEDIIK